MKLTDVIKDEKLSLSFEVFPPKTDAAFDGVLQATEEIAALKPSFISVTYGAGGTGGKYTREIASRLQNAEGVETLAHLTCVGAGREDVEAYLQQLREDGIHNIMALRGDLPEGMDPEKIDPDDPEERGFLHRRGVLPGGASGEYQPGRGPAIPEGKSGGRGGLSDDADVL